MRYGIISDIHGNLEALESVLSEGRKQGVRSFFCAGDIVGYGANPHECLQLLAQHKVHAIAGNHDWAVVGKTDPAEFNEVGEAAVYWTRKNITKEDEKTLKGLELVYRQEDFEMVHGTLNQPEQFHYLFDITWSADTFYLMKTRVCFVGHTHVPQIFVQGDERVDYAAETTVHLEDEKKYIVNVGSVGQPRDENPKASFCIYDPDLKRVEIKRVAYDIKKAQKKIYEAGLPPFLAERLTIGH